MVARPRREEVATRGDRVRTRNRAYQLIPPPARTNLTPTLQSGQHAASPPVGLSAAVHPGKAIVGVVRRQGES